VSAHRGARTPGSTFNNDRENHQEELDMSRVAHDVSEIVDRVRLSGLQKSTIVLCALVAILDGFDTQAIAFVAPVIAAQWQLGPSSFGPTFGAGLLGLTLGALVFGPVADVVGRRRVIIAATVWFGVFSLATVQAETMTQLAVYRLLTGIGLGGAMPNIIALTAEYAPERNRATLITLMFCGFPLGAVLGGAISAPIIGAFGWQAVFVMGGILPLLLAVVLALALPESIRFLVGSGADARRIAAIVSRIDPAHRYDDRDRYVVPEQRLAGVPVKHLFRDGRATGTLLLWVVFFCNLLVLYFLINWLPSVLRAAGLPIEHAIIATVVLNAGGIAGGLALGRFVDRRGPFAILLSSYGCAALAVAAIGVAGTTLSAIMATVFVAGFFVIGTQFCMNALAAGAYPTSVRATGVGYALGVGRIGSVLGPVIGGMLLALGWSTSTLFLAAAVPAVVCAAAVALLRLQYRAPLAQLTDRTTPITAPIDPRTRPA
jgi:AAHS family 4-hydroxybenzoate transporter-like MFS transporter